KRRKPWRAAALDRCAAAGYRLARMAFASRRPEANPRILRRTAQGPVERMPKKILIAGAGIGGLTAAACLIKAGHDVQIFEQAPELIEVGAGIQMSANAMHVLVDLGLADALSAIAVRPEAYVFRLHDTGEVISQFALADEHLRLHRAPYNQLHRADF